MQSPLQWVTAVPGTVAGRPKATGYISRLSSRKKLLHCGAFWKPFGTFWTPWATFFGPRDDSWPISGPGCKKLRKNYNLVELWWLPACPIWHYFAAFDDFLAACFLLFFWVPIFLTICSSGVHLGSNWRCFLGYLGPLEIGLKRWRGYDFHTLEVLFAGMVSKLDRVDVFL